MLNKDFQRAFFFLLLVALGPGRIQAGSAEDSTRDIIQQELITFQRGPHLVAGWPYIMDSIIRKDNYDGIRIFDPYGTLKGCVLFGVKSSVPEDGLSGIGIYKDGKILWLSDMFHVAYPDGPHLEFAVDLNADSTVDICLGWRDDGGNSGNPGPEDYCIYSWDGRKGWAIDPRSEDSLLEIDGCTECVVNTDIDGDGIDELLVGGYGDTPDTSDDAPYTIPDDAPDGMGDIVYSWNGKSYVAASTREKVLKRQQFSVAGNLSVHVDARVDPPDSLGRFSYNYSLHNDQSSKQRLQMLSFEVPIDTTSSKVVMPYGWEVGWNSFSTDFPTKKLTPGQSLNGFRWLASAPPTISIYYAQADFCDLRVGEPLEGVKMQKGVTIQTKNAAESNFQKDMRKNLLNNSNRGLTIVPQENYAAMGPSAFIDTVKSFVRRANSFGWIKDRKESRKYSAYLDSTRTKLQLKDYGGSIQLLDTIILETVKDSSSVLSPEAYALIKYNALYLKNKLSSGSGQKRHR